MHNSNREVEGKRKEMQNSVREVQKTEREREREREGGRCKRERGRGAIEIEHSPKLWVTVWQWDSKGEGIFKLFDFPILFERPSYYFKKKIPSNIHHFKNSLDLISKQVILICHILNPLEKLNSSLKAPDPITLL